MGGLALLAINALNAVRRAAAGGSRLDDLTTYVGSIDSLRHHAGLYSYHAAITNDSFTYPPFAGIVLFPVSLISRYWVDHAWTAITCLSVVVIALIVGRDMARDLFDQRIASGFVLLILAISSPVSSDLRFGQISIMLGVLIVIDSLFLKGVRGGGILIGLAAGVKLTPLIFIPFLWIVGRRRDAIRALVFFALTVLVAAVLLPGESQTFWLSGIFKGGDVHAYLAPGNASLEAVLARAGLGGVPLQAFWSVLVVLVFAVALWRARKAAKVENDLVAMVIVGCAGIVISPISWTHHQVWIVLAAFLPVWMASRYRYAWNLLAVVAMIIGPAEIRPFLAILVAVVVPFSRPVSAGKAVEERAVAQDDEGQGAAVAG